MTTSLRSKTTIDLIISTEQERSVQCQQLPYNGSDHFPILAEFNTININNPQQYIQKVNWNLYTSILSILNTELDHDRQQSNLHPFEWFQFFQEFISALKLRATTWHKIAKRRPTITEALRIMIKHKHYLQNRFRRTKTEEDRLSLRSWHKVIQQELKQHRANCWNQFIDKVASPKPSSFWNTIKTLNSKRSVEFSAITEGNSILKKPNEILFLLRASLSRNIYTASH